MKDYKPFDFVTAASYSKEDLIGDSENQTTTEKMYNPYLTNKAFSMIDDSILHANEMNMRSHLFPRAQFDYYRSVLRKRKRFSKWPKVEKSEELDAIQKVYECNRTIAKLYLKVFTKEQLKMIKEKLQEGGASR